MRRTESGGTWWLSPGAAGVAALAPAVVAIFICAHQLTLRGVLDGSVLGNEGANLGSALALTRGALPYSNFPLAQPPGMLILLLPLAWLTHFVTPSLIRPLGRLLTAAVTVVSVYLAGLAARPYGVPASLLAGIFTATYPLAFLSTAGVTVGPFILLFTLIGITLGFRQGGVADGTRALFAGLFLGFACTIKPWALIPALVLVGCALAAWDQKRDKLLPVAGGIVLGIAVPCVIFVLAAPRAFWQDVVRAELPGHGVAAVGAKLATVLGLTGATGIAQPSGLGLTIAVVMLVVVVAVALAAIRDATPYDWFVTFTLIGVIAVVFLPGTMSPQYGEFALPLIAIGVAVTAGRLLGLIAASWTGKRNDARGSIATALAVLVVGCTVVITAVASPADGRYSSQYADAHAVIAKTAIDGAIPAGSCVISNDPTLLIEANRFVANGVSCPVAVDPAGVLAITRVQGGRPAAVQQWVQWINIAKYVVLTSPPTYVPFQGALAADFHAHYAIVARRPRFSIYVRSH
ncbi:MAG: hypothetical protein ACYDC0_01195 [Acidimicrobiales bacterium]